MRPFATIRKFPKVKEANALAFSVIFLGSVIILATLVFDRTSSNITSTGRRIDGQEAIRVAEAGIEKAVWCMNNPSNSTDCPGNPNYIGEADVPFGRGKFTTTITRTSTAATIDAFSTIAGALGDTEKHLRVELTTTDVDVAFQYGVQAGIGGIELGNNAFVDGNVYAGGSVTGTNGSYINGDAILTLSNPTLEIDTNPSVSPLNTTNFGQNNGTKYIAQSFISPVTEKAFGFGLKMARVNSPSLNVTFYIYSDSGNAPDQNLSGTGQALSASFPTDAPGWENSFTEQVFSPNINPVLQAGTKYWLVITIQQTNNSNYWQLVRDTNGSTYANGTAKVGGGLGSLTDVCVGGCDLAFQLKMGGVPPVLKIPNVRGNAYSRTIESTTIDGEAHYQNLIGQVRANNGTVTCAEGNTGPDCFDNAVDQPPASFPISDAQIAQMEAQAEGGGTTNCTPTCIILDGASIGPQRYNGDVLLDNGAEVELTGTVWVNGNLTIDNNSLLRLSDAYGTGSGTIIADYVADQTLKGKILLQNNGNIVGNSTPDTYVMAISMHRDQIFSAATVNVLNNLSAAVIYTPYGIVEISNNAALKEVTAQKLILRENTSVTYESGLANVKFTSGPGGSWIYRKGSYQIIR